MVYVKAPVQLNSLDILQHSGVEFRLEGKNYELIYEI